METVLKILHRTCLPGRREIALSWSGEKGTLIAGVLQSQTEIAVYVHHSLLLGGAPEELPGA